MVICHCRDAIVASKSNQPCSPSHTGETATVSRVVCTHNTPGTGIYNRPLEGRQPTRSQVNKSPRGASSRRVYARSTQVPLASLNRTSIEALLWLAESGKVLNHC
jgi:hypothetical protein